MNIKKEGQKNDRLTENNKIILNSHISNIYLKLKQKIKHLFYLNSALQ
jgi:hypothetical protein